MVSKHSEYIAVGLSHHTAPVAIRERFAVEADRLPAILEMMRARPGVREAMLLGTCNRVEWYLVAADQAMALASVTAFFAAQARSRAGYAGPASVGLPDLRMIAPEERSALLPALRSMSGPDAVRHLFRVASGLDSMIVGETQILGQVRAAFAAAQAAGTAGPHLDALLRAAIAAGRRVRRETGIGSGSPSVPAAAVVHAGRLLGSLAGRRVLIIGAGEMGVATVRALVRAGVREVVVANRTSRTARTVAAAVDGVVAPFERLEDELQRADIVITSTTAPHVILDAANLAAASRDRTSPLVIIDIAVPRNVDPESRRLPGVHLYDIDDLQDQMSPGVDGRTEDVRRAEHLVNAEVEAFLRARAARSAASVIAAARADAEAIADREWARARARLSRLSAHEEATVRAVLRRVVHKILHRPITALAEAAGNGHDPEIGEDGRAPMPSGSGRGQPG